MENLIDDVEAGNHNSRPVISMPIASPEGGDTAWIVIAEVAVEMQGILDLMGI